MAKVRGGWGETGEGGCQRVKTRLKQLFYPRQEIKYCHRVM